MGCSVFYVRYKTNEPGNAEGRKRATQTKKRRLSGAFELRFEGREEA